MSEYPPESASPSYQPPTYWDAYCKFLLWGAQKEPLPKRLRVFNKPGDAYGFLTDVAYVADLDNHIEFMLAANIYCNSDGILNNDHYDYETVGWPFMKHLGEVIYAYEKQRERAQVPDLSAFELTYD